MQKESETMCLGNSLQRVVSRFIDNFAQLMLLTDDILGYIQYAYFVFRRCAKHVLHSPSGSIGTAYTDHGLDRTMLAPAFVWFSFLSLYIFWFLVTCARLSWPHSAFQSTLNSGLSYVPVVRLYASQALSVWQDVCLSSVTLLYCVKTAKRIVT